MEYTNRTWIDSTSKRMFGEWSILENGKKIHEVIDTEKGCRLYTFSEIKTLLDNIGFDVLLVYSDFSKKSFESNNQQMLVVAKKRNDKNIA